MGKGAITRQLIIERAAAVLNQRGYAATSLADIMAATGLEKGGIYNHFTGKDDLALAAFEYAISLTWGCLRDQMRGASGAVARLVALTEGYRIMADHPVLPGGCPLLNLGVETPYTHPALRDRVRTAMTDLCRFIAHVIARGQERGEIRPEVDGAALAPLLLGTIEGGIFLAKLYDDPGYVHRAVDSVVAMLRATLPISPIAPLLRNIDDETCLL